MSRTGPSINVECDGCGDFVEVELVDSTVNTDLVVDACLAKLKWHVTDEGDFCPDCSGKTECEECGEMVDYTEHCLGCSQVVCAECQKDHDERDCTQDGFDGDEGQREWAEEQDDDGPDDED